MIMQSTRVQIKREELLFLAWWAVKAWFLRKNLVVAGIEMVAGEIIDHYYQEDEDDA